MNASYAEHPVLKSRQNFNSGSGKFSMGSVKEISLTLFLIVMGLLVGLLTGETGWSFCAAAVVWIILQTDQFRQVARWAERPWRKPENGLDSWFNIAYRPYRALLRERHRTRQATTRLRQILNLIELIPDGVIVLGPSGELEGMNNAAKRMLNIGTPDLGLGLSTVVREPEFVSFIRADVSDDPQILEFASPFDLEHTLEARRFRVEGGGLIVIVRDITTLNRLLTVRQNFVANVSHELRTPLAVIKGYMETITDTAESAETRLDLIQRLVSPLDRMQSLVDELMLLTRLESTDEESSLVRVDLGLIISNAVAELGDLYRTEERVVLHLDESVTIMGIEAELHSLCINLLSNALRYSPEDSIVEVRCRNLGNRIKLEVQDHGVGIPREHLERLTERFYRVDMADSRTRGGTGLGLAIVKHVLRRHGSALQIKTELGVGSTFASEFRIVERRPSSSKLSNP